MTRAEQIAQALKLLAPPPSEHAECRHDIETMLNWVDSRTKNLEMLKATRSSEGTKALKGYKKALGRLQEAYDALGSAKPWFSLGQSGQPTIVERELDKVAAFLAGKAPPKRGDRGISVVGTVGTQGQRYARQRMGPAGPNSGQYRQVRF
jgi:hypothetical protein